MVLMAIEIQLPLSDQFGFWEYVEAFIGSVPLEAWVETLPFAASTERESKQRFKLLGR
jgi:hypothetical protein